MNRFANVTPQQAWDGNVTQSVEAYASAGAEPIEDWDVEMMSYVAYYCASAGWTDAEARTLARLLATYARQEMSGGATSMQVWFIPNDAIDQDDPYWAEHVDHYVQPGTLVTDHPVGSYGQAVILGEDGTPYGPADVYDRGWSGEMGARRNRALEAAADAAGFDRVSSQVETDETY